MLDQPSWRIELYRLKSDGSYPGYVSDISNFYTSDLTIQKERNYPDEVHFTLDLQQLQERAAELGLDVNMMLEPYKSLIKVYRNNTFYTQVVVEKTTVNLNNQGNNTVEVSCVDWLGILDKRLIHQDYGEGSWADFANEVIMDAQHEPNRIYNYAFEGDGTGIDNVWFRGWKYHVPASLSSTFKEWESGVTYQMYAHVTYNGKFWECNETHISEDTFSESYWEEVGTTTDNRQTNFTPIYAVWREDEEEAGPTGTNLGGWGGTSSCHMTARTQTYNTPISGTINLAGSAISTSLVAPIAQGSVHDDVFVPNEYQVLDYLEGTGTQYIDTDQFGDGFKLGDLGSFTIETTFQYTSVISNTQNNLFGSENSSAPYNSCIFRIPAATQTKFESWYGNETFNTGTDLSVTDKHEMTLYYDSVNEEIEATIDDESYTSTTSGSETGTFSNYPLALFASRIGDTFVRNSKVKIWGFKIYDDSNSDILNLIPVIRKSDGVVGMYDTVSKRLFENGGSEPFKYSHNTSPSIGSTYTRVMAKALSSNSVSGLPNGYTKVDYIRTNDARGIMLRENYIAEYETTFYDDIVEADLLLNSFCPTGEETSQYYTICSSSMPFSDYSHLGLSASYSYTEPPVLEKKASGMWAGHGGAYMLGTISINAGERFTFSGRLSSGNSYIKINNNTVATSTSTAGAGMDIRDVVILGRLFTEEPSPFFGPQDFSVYSFKITKASTGVVILNLIPCIRNSDNKPGFYETVKGKFFTYEEYTSSPIASFKTFVESYDGENRVYSDTQYINSLGWEKKEYVFGEQDSDIYRYGIQIESGEILFDSPVVYKQREDGDEWDLGLRPGLFPTISEQEDAKWRHDRFSSTFEWKSAKETLQDLSNMDSDNFWFSIDKNKRFNVSINGGGRDVAVDLSYPKNITSMTVSSNAADIVNYIKGDGSAEVSQDPLVSGVKNSNGAPFTWIGYNIESMNEYWPLAATESFDSERTITNLKADIDARLSTYSKILDVPEITIENNAVDLSKLNLGDIIAVSALNNPYVQKINGLYKIEAIKIKVGVDGGETLSLTLLNTDATQLNALTFPQIIKAIMRRTNY